MRLTEKVFKECKRKKPKAQQVLFDLFKARVMGLCRRYASSREEAEDIFQEAFLKIFTRIDSVREFEYLERWIVKTSIHTAVNYYHKNKRHHDYLSTEHLEVFDENDGNVLDSLSMEQLISLVNKLPSGYRLVFNLYVVEGYKHTEIGELLNISENTSKSQLNRAKMALKKNLKELGIKKYQKYG